MKLLMREFFVNPPPALNSYNEVHNLEDQSIVISPSRPNLLQDCEHKQEDKDDEKENEELTTSGKVSEPSLHSAPIIPAENEKDLEEIDQTVRAALKFVTVKQVDEVFVHALTCPPVAEYSAVAAMNESAIAIGGGIPVCQ